MLTGELRSQIDRVWNAFWTGGLSNPLMVIDQITYLLYIKRLDDLQTNLDNKARLSGETATSYIFMPDQQDLRWQYFKNLDPEKMFDLFRKAGGVFDHIKSMGAENGIFSRYMKGANFMIPTPRLLAQVIDLISDINMNDRDTKGDVYEYLLSKIATSGDNGQFRTPRHIIKMMVALMQPTPDDILCDPSGGTFGFLVLSGEYLREKYPDLLLNPHTREHFMNHAFTGMEFDPTMLRIGAMNLNLHGIENPQIQDVDALSRANSGFVEKATLILANPPFKGSLDTDAVNPEILRIVQTRNTELLFLSLMLQGLKTGGRCAVIVPDGVLFGSGKAHRQLRREIVEKHRLQAVISMPSGVFKPYAGVSTGILVFTKTNSGGTDQVWFYDMLADGYSLDDKRQPLAPEFETFADLEALVNRYAQQPDQAQGTDIPELLWRWQHPDAEATTPPHCPQFYGSGSRNPGEPLRPEPEPLPRSSL